jgi:hypothetical protein
MHTGYASGGEDKCVKNGIILHHWGHAYRVRTQQGGKMLLKWNSFSPLQACVLGMHAAWGEKMEIMCNYFSPAGTCVRSTHAVGGENSKKYEIIHLYLRHAYWVRTQQRGKMLIK